MKLIEVVQNFLKRIVANRMPILWSGCLVLLVCGFLFFFYSPPSADVGPEQPIPFSHRLHAGAKAIDCKFCHPYVARSKFPGLPPGEKCLYCHNYIIVKHPWIQKEHQYFNTETPVPWVKANFLPEHVLFNHQRHILKGFQCEKCHGDIASMDRIKGERFKMGFCFRCHQENNGNLDCWLACHS